MSDLSWLSQEAKKIHDIFEMLFYSLITVFLLLGILAEYFKWPLGLVPSFSSLIGRIFIAIFLLHTFSDVTNLLADVTDGLAAKLGTLNEFHLVLDRMGDKIGELTWSWLSVRETTTLILSFVTYFLLYFSVHVANAFIIYTWTLLFVFSPLLIALYVLPVTASATKSLYRSLIEVSCWKIVWSVLATLVWSAALSDINKPGNDISFLSAICFNLILAGSLLLTPIVVHALAAGGVDKLSRTLGSIAVGTVVLGPAGLMKSGVDVAKRSYQMGRSSLSNNPKRRFGPHSKRPPNKPRK